jgi:FADH2 O2-dependent halogenase
MVYFAAAITYEELRTAPSDRTLLFDRGFLGAGDPSLSAIVRQLYGELVQMTTGEFGERQVCAFERRVAALIAPYNTAGLFAPRLPNMYEYTAAELG